MLQRHYVDQLMMSLFDQEAVYDGGPAAWLDANACSMLEFDDASAHEEWDDVLVSNDDVIIGKEFADKQLFARNSMRLTYTEPRAKPNTLAGLMSLALGSVSSVQDAALDAWRHDISPSNAFSLPSIGLQTKHEGGRQYKYTGVKLDSYTFSLGADFMQFAATLVGSGTRAEAADAFAASISENWLRFRDSKLFIKDTGGTPITLPGTPVQGAANLGGSEVEVSSRLINFSQVWNNNLQADAGYRAGVGLVRSNLHPGRRGSTISFSLDVDSATEADELDYYLNQSKLAVEFNLDSGEVIDAGGAFNFGVIIILPLVQLTSIPRGTESERETLTLEGRVLDDGTNPEAQIHVYTGQAAYLA